MRVSTRRTGEAREGRLKALRWSADDLAMTASGAATIAWHVDRWAQEMAAARTEFPARSAHGQGLASACRDADGAGLPAALVALARRLPEGDLASLEARLVRSLARASA